jgi:hypothetical protein
MANMYLTNPRKQFSIIPYDNSAIFFTCALHGQ